MKLIGLEFRVGMQNMRQIEVACFPLEITFPWARPYPFGPEANVTLHTSMGDANAAFVLSQLCRGELPFDRVDQKTIDEAYESLKKQVERVR